MTFRSGNSLHSACILLCVKLPKEMGKIARSCVSGARRSVLLCLLLAGIMARAQGGPPFITDDPGTPGNHHWEINFGWIGNHNPGQSYYDIPNVDMNYGWGDRIQLKYEIPLAAATNADNSTSAGLGESLLGVKWRYFEYHKRGEAKSDDTFFTRWARIRRSRSITQPAACAEASWFPARCTICPLRPPRRSGPFL